MQHIVYELALCAGSGLTDLFFSEEPRDLEEAKLICGQCPVRESCFQLAIARKEHWGVWGGRIFWDGQILDVKRKRGRPPKVVQPLAS